MHSLNLRKCERHLLRHLGKPVLSDWQAADEGAKGKAAGFGTLRLKSARRQSLEPMQGSPIAGACLSKSLARFLSLCSKCVFNTICKSITTERRNIKRFVEILISKTCSDILIRRCIGAITTKSLYSKGIVVKFEYFDYRNASLNEMCSKRAKRQELSAQTSRNSHCFTTISSL